MKKKINSIIQNKARIGLVVCLSWALPAPALTSLAITVWGMAPTQAHAQDVKLTVRGSGLKVPRFVTLKFNETNLRAGPGREYPVLWQYQTAGLPLQVNAEFGVWRKVVDHDGVTGWMRGSVLTLKRKALVQSSMANIHQDDNATSPVIAMAERNALMELQSCPKAWCRVAAKDMRGDAVRGWIKRSAIWGILNDESLD